MITYDSKRKIFHLQSKSVSYVFGLRFDRYLTHMYWGKRLENPLNDYEDFFPFALSKRNNSAIDHMEDGISTDIIPMEYPTFGNCDLRQPAFHALYEDGSRQTEPEYVSHTIYAGKKGLDGLPATYVEDNSEADTLEIELADRLTGLKLTLVYTCFNDYDAITRSVRVENAGTSVIRLKSVLSANVDIVGDNYDFVHLPGSWARERHIERTPLFTGNQNIESRRGLSSAEHSPFFALAEKNADELQGEVFGFNLIYSGNFTAGVEVDNYGTSRAYIGINPFDFDFCLSAGEKFVSPEAVLVYSNQGLSGMSRIYHKLFRERLVRGKFRDAERYVLINNWEATYFNFNEEKIVNIAAKAKEVGVELMVLDDGWFGHRNSDNSSLGDWYVNTDKLPGGLKSLADKINALGMKFGLWFEPEMISPDSDCYRAHPDWCIHIKDRNRALSRNQLMLDLSREDVCDYIINSVSDVLYSANIEYVKWDYNRTMTNIGTNSLPPNRQGEFYHRYILGLYHILETLVERFPNILFESCASGGARFDGGMLYYMPQTWCSDDTDAVERSYIQYGTSLCYPFSSMGAHVSAVPNHQVHRTTPLAARGVIAMQGQLGYELDLNKLSEDELSEVKNQIRFYKKYGEVFHKGDLYRLSNPVENNVSANEFVSENGSTVILSLLAVQGTPTPTVNRIRLAGLDADASYKPENSDVVYSGSMLMNYGIFFQPDSDCKSRVIVFNKL